MLFFFFCHIDYWNMYMGGGAMKMFSGDGIWKPEPSGTYKSKSSPYARYVTAVNHAAIHTWITKVIIRNEQNTKYNKD